MTLPYTDPALPSATTPYFMDNSFVRGDQMRANNQRIWGNSQSLDTRLTTAESGIAQMSYEWWKYGVTTINTLATLYSQWTTIASYVTSKNILASPFAPTADGSVSAAATASVSVPSALGVASTLLSNGNVLISVTDNAASGFCYFFIYNASNGTVSAAATASVSVPNAWGVASTLLSNGNVLISVADYTASGLCYFFIYNASNGTVAAAATASVSVPNAFSVFSTLLSNGNVLISVADFVASGLCYFFIYNASNGTVSAAATASVSVPNANSVASTLLSNGNVLISVTDYTASGLCYFFIYNASNGTVAAAATASVSVPNACRVSSTLLSNGNVLISVIDLAASGFCYFFIYHASNGTVAAAATANVGVPNANSVASTLLSNGNVLISVADSTASGFCYFFIYNASTGTVAATASVSVPNAFLVASTLLSNGNVLISVSDSAASGFCYFFIGTGAWGPSNRYQFPTELYQAGMV